MVQGGRYQGSKDHVADSDRYDRKCGIPEAAPAEQWGSMKRTVFNTVIGAGAGAFATGAIYMMAQFIK